MPPQDSPHPPPFSLSVEDYIQECVKQSTASAQVATKPPWWQSETSVKWFLAAATFMGTVITCVIGYVQYDGNRQLKEAELIRTSVSLKDDLARGRMFDFLRAYFDAQDREELTAWASARATGMSENYRRGAILRTSRMLMLLLGKLETERTNEQTPNTFNYQTGKSEPEPESSRVAREERLRALDLRISGVRKDLDALVGVAWSFVLHPESVTNVEDLLKDVGRDTKHAFLFAPPPAEENTQPQQQQQQTVEALTSVH